MIKINSYTKILPYIKKYKNLLLLTILLYLIQSLFFLPLPLLTKYLIDYILPKKQFKYLLVMIIMLVIVLFIRAIIQYFSGYLQEFIGEKLGMDLKMNVFKHIIRLPVKYFEENTSGYISTRILGDVSAIQGIVVDVFSNLLRDGLTVMVGIIAVFYLSWKLALVSVIFLPFYIYFTFIYSKKLKEYSKNVREESALLSGFLKENLLVIRLIKNFNLENWSDLRFFLSQKKYVRKILELFKVRIRFISFITFVNGISPLIVLGFGGYLMIQGDITLGTLVAFSSFAGYLYNPIRGLMSMNQRIQEGLASFARIVEILNEKPEYKNRIKKIENADIEYKNIQYLHFQFS